MGEHADFAGNYEGIPTRFDVTTNIKFKKFRDYEPYVGDGIRYQIALLDEQSFEIVDVCRPRTEGFGAIKAARSAR